jgi:RNA polymerase sigma-70 factor (ECF subfamily)
MSKRTKTYKELATEFKRTKSEKVFNDLYKKMRPGLWSYIFKIVKDHDAADDITSTTLTTIYLKIDQYDEQYQITTWAYKIAFNDCIGWLRFKNRTVSAEVFTEKGVESIFEPKVDVFNCETETQRELLEKDFLLDEKVRLLTESIDSLPTMYKNYMVERFLNKKSYNEILDIMLKNESDISLQTVKNRIFRGRKLVKDKLEKLPIFTEN